MKTITATVPAWITGNAYLLHEINAMTPERAVSALAFFHPFNEDGSGPNGWVKVGTAEITVTFDDEAEITGQQITHLRAAQQKVKADCEVALNQLEGQIQSLLAIESKP